MNLRNVKKKFLNFVEETSASVDDPLFRHTNQTTENDKWHYEICTALFNRVRNDEFNEINFQILTVNLKVIISQAPKITSLNPKPAES